VIGVYVVRSIITERAVYIATIMVIVRCAYRALTVVLQSWVCTARIMVMDTGSEIGRIIFMEISIYKASSVLIMRGVYIAITTVMLSVVSVPRTVFIEGRVCIASIMVMV
jgi:hypothetical protein